MKRKAGYSWHLREVMARNKVYTATELIPMLHDRGIDAGWEVPDGISTGAPNGEVSRGRVLPGSAQWLMRPGQPTAGWPSQCVNQERVRSRTSIWWARSVKTWPSRG